MPMKLYKSIFLFLIVLLLPWMIAENSHAADKIVLKNNSVIEGKIIGEKGSQVIIQDPGGKITRGIPKSDILEIIMEKPESFVNAEQAFKRKKYEEAIKLYNEVVSGYGLSEWGERALIGIGRAYMKLNNGDEACRAFEKFLSVYRDSDLYCEAGLFLGKIYSDRGLSDKAEAVYEKILKNNYSGKGPAEVQFRLGEICLKKKKLEKALMNFLRVVVVFYGETEIVQKAMIRSGLCYERMEDYVNADRIYRELVREFQKGEHVKEAKEKILELEDKLKKEEKNEDSNGFTYACAGWGNPFCAGGKS